MSHLCFVTWQSCISFHSFVPFEGKLSNEHAEDNLKKQEARLQARRASLKVAISSSSSCHSPTTHNPSSQGHLERILGEEAGAPVGGGREALAATKQLMRCMFLTSRRNIYALKKTSAHVCVNIRIGTYIYIYTYLNTEMYICICIRTYVRTYIHTYIHTYMTLHYITLHTYIHTYIHTYVHTYIHTYIHTYVCMYVCMYVCTYVHRNIYVDVYTYIYDVFIHNGICICVCTQRLT